MELALSPDDAAFRDEGRAFIKDNYPAEMRVANPETDPYRGARNNTDGRNPAGHVMAKIAIDDGIGSIRYGVVTMCIGGGMGAAGLIEIIN